MVTLTAKAHVTGPDLPKLGVPLAQQVRYSTQYTFFVDHVDVTLHADGHWSAWVRGPRVTARGVPGRVQHEKLYGSRLHDDNCAAPTWLSRLVSHLQARAAVADWAPRIPTHIRHHYRKAHA